MGFEKSRERLVHAARAFEDEPRRGTLDDVVEDHVRRTEVESSAHAGDQSVNELGIARLLPAVQVCVEHAALAQMEARLPPIGLEVQVEHARPALHLEDAEERGEPDLFELASKAGELDRPVDCGDQLGENVIEAMRQLG